MSSLASLFARWLSPPAAEPSLRPPPLARAAAPAADRAFACGDQGLPAIGVTEVIAPHCDWLKRLRYAYGAEPTAFDRDIVSVVERYAQYVHLLPATADRHFHRPGGLFRMGLEIGFYALQAADGAIFAGRLTISQRAALEPRWRYATFLAGLVSGLDDSLSQCTVSNDRGEHWSAHLQPLWLWLQFTKSPRYQVRWQPRVQPTGTLGEMALSHIVSPAIMRELAAGNSRVIAHLIASLRGTALPGESNTLAELVRRSSALVIAADRGTKTDLPPAVSEAPPTASMAQLALPLPGQRGTPAADGCSLPARLHPAVRAALRQIIATLDPPARAPAAAIIELGVFVPLREWARRGVDPALAVRSLSDARLLACDPSAPKSKTCARTFGGETILGVVLAPQCGFDARALGAAIER